jgi:hypothetical protein
MVAIYQEGQKRYLFQHPLLFFLENVHLRRFPICNESAHINVLISAFPGRAKRISDNDIGET